LASKRHLQLFSPTFLIHFVMRHRDGSLFR